MKEQILKIPFEDLDRIYITSDTHYGHKNICRGTSEWTVKLEGDVKMPIKDFIRMINGEEDGWAQVQRHTRALQTIDEMNEILVDNINATVPEDAILFHLGDWSFGGFEKIEEFRSQINCKEIHIVAGNHDHHIERGKAQHLFASQWKYLELKIGKMIFVLCHFPFQSWNHMSRGAYHLHGHVHLPGHLKMGNGRKMDVGVDGNNLFPYKLTDVIAELKDRVFVDENDHHTR